MSEPLDENSETRLRAALHAEVNDLRPSGEALERIRTRTSARRFAWLDGALGAWLRPVAALAATVALAASVILSMPQLRDELLPAGDQQAAPPPPPETSQETVAGEVTPQHEPETDPSPDEDEDSPTPTESPEEPDDLTEDQLTAAAEACSVEPGELLAAREGQNGGENDTVLSADEAEECLEDFESENGQDEDGDPDSPDPDEPTPTESPTEEDSPPEPTTVPEEVE